jgi:hypothetical protein
VTTQENWPELPFASWSDTLNTLHRWTQIVGKTRMSHSPMQNHWWHATLYVTPRGLSTSSVPHGERSFDIEFDFIEHALGVRVSDGRTRSIPLRRMSVADFYHEYIGVLESLGIDADIYPAPNEMADNLRFEDDRVHASYDPDAVSRCWRVLSHADRLFKIMRGPYLGKSSPSHFWCGGFDLSFTRFSGRRAPTHPGGVPNCPDYVQVEAYSHECMSVGWWPGSPGGLEEPAFYAYVYPEPPGCPEAPIRPAEARYDMGMREWILPYEAVRKSSDPDSLVLSFCAATYEAAASLGKWNREALER